MLLPQTELQANLCFLAGGTVTVVRVFTGGTQNERTKDVPEANTEMPLRNTGRSLWGQGGMRECEKAIGRMRE